MKHIVLTQEKIALVSDRDLSFIKSYGSWCAFKQRNGDFYAVHVTAYAQAALKFHKHFAHPDMRGLSCL